jgi:serine/threonine protein phosphatase 1
MSMIDRYARNAAGRDLIVGDIHGRYVDLDLQLQEVGFDGTKDRLFSVGDLVDRGPFSESVLGWLQEPWFHAVQGNHEQMAILFAAGQFDPLMYARNGGAWLIAKTPDERLEYAKAFAQLPWVIEIETELGDVGVIHAACESRSWGEFKKAIEAGASRVIENATWGRTRFAEVHEFPPVQGIRAIVVGHNMTRTVKRLQNVIHIDTRSAGAEFTLLNALTLQPEPRK